MLNEKEFISEIRQIMEQFKAASLTNSLRLVLLDYLILQDDYPTDIKEILLDINILFDILNTIAKLKGSDSDVV